MTATYDSIATTTLGSAASSITFSSIPNTYTDLRLVLAFTVSGSTSGGNAIMRFNSDSGTNYSFTVLYGDGSTAGSYATSNDSFVLTFITSGSTTNPTFSITDIFSYAGSTNKTILVNGNEDLNGSGGVARSVQLWRNTSAVSSITLSYASGAGGKFATGTTATLYGILKA